MMTLKPDTFRQQLASMLQLQDSMNKMVFPDWAERNLAWHRAIYIEAGEYLEHLGTWKWWKKGQPDFPQANMELVDIWHFGLSWYLDRNGGAVTDAVIERILSDVQLSVESLQVIQHTEVTDEMRHVQVDSLVAAAGQRIFDIRAFVHLLAYSGLTFDRLAQSYIGKNMLNRFRQANGYKTGTYVKVWAGQEDNVHLDAILLTTDDVPPASLADVIYAALTAAYRQHTPDGSPT